MRNEDENLAGVFKVLGNKPKREKVKRGDVDGWVKRSEQLDGEIERERLRREAAREFGPSRSWRARRAKKRSEKARKARETKRKALESGRNGVWTGKTTLSGGRVALVARKAGHSGSKRIFREWLAANPWSTARECREGLDIPFGSIKNYLSNGKRDGLVLAREREKAPHYPGGPLLAVLEYRLAGDYDPPADDDKPGGEDWDFLD